MFRTPLILAPIAGPGTPELTAAVCNAGAFGILASPYSSPDQIREDAARIRALTDAPFGINLFIEPPIPAIDPGLLQAAHERLKPYYEELGLAFPAQPGLPRADYEKQVEALLTIRPAVFSFTFGIPQTDVLREVKRAGIFTMGTATTVAEALALQDVGVDAVCAQGAEAGGHRGTFLADAREALVGTLALVPQVADAVEIPVIAAGGITDGRGIAAVLALGAVAAQCGTAFLLAHEAATSPAYRRALERAAETDTMITNAFSGRAARGIRNRFALDMDDPKLQAAYPYQNALTRDLRLKAAQAENADLLSLWAGQAFRLARAAPAAQIVEEMLSEAKAAAAVAVRELQSAPGQRDPSRQDELPPRTSS